MSNFPIKVGDSSGIDTYVSTLISGEEQLLITRDGKQYLTKGDGTKIEVSDIIVVSSLPSSQIQINKIYILSTDFSLNYYDTSWHVLSSNNQISIGTIAPTDTTKLWLDNTTSAPIFKYHNGTSWINISGSISTSDQAKVDSIITSGDGTKFKSDDGTYKLILNNINEPIIINSSNWILDETTNTYKLTINHNLKTKNIITAMYDNLEQINLLGITRISLDSIQLENNSAIDGELIINYSSSVNTNLSNLRWNGKILNCLGDSITWGQETTKIYHQFLKEQMNLINVNNYGIPGTTITSIDDSTAMSIRYSEMDNNADIILVFGGTNDYGLNKPIGIKTDTTVSTFYGALKILIEGLTNKYPTKTIVFITPLQRNYQGGGQEANELGFSLLQYVDAIIEICGLYSIPVLDLYRYSGINLVNMSTFIVDGAHPNEAGHERIAYKMASFLNAQ